MNAKYDRHINLINFLLRNPRTTYANLAFEFGVSTKTIKQDVAELGYHFPIDTFQGNGGGVEMNKCGVIDGFFMRRKHIELIIEGLILLSEGSSDDKGEIIYILSLIAPR
ncbi:MAG: hypothetical protein LBT55_04750 [Clostridiaceae bacterium]|nr:hypothetical protein [Clostridiaceae bacterium]